MGGHKNKKVLHCDKSVVSRWARRCEAAVNVNEETGKGENPR